MPYNGNKAGLSWLSVHVYPHSNDLNEIIRKVYSKIEEALDKEYIRSSFFIRYWDPKSHLRMRFLCVEGVPVVRKFIEDFLDECLHVEHYLFVDYVPEIDRYGGVRFINTVEEIFGYSSKVTTELVLSKNSFTYNDSISNSLKLNLIFMHAWQLKIETIKELCTLMQNQWMPSLLSFAEDNQRSLGRDNILREFESQYQKYKMPLSQIIDLIYSHDHMPNLGSDAFSNWWNSCRNLYCEVKNNGYQFLSKKRKSVLLTSLMHMNNNRIGVSNPDESFCSYLLHNSFDSL